MLKQFLASDPSDDFSEYALALEFVQTRLKKEAIAHFENILKRNPSYLAAYYQAGRAYEAEKNFKKAAELYEKGMAVAKEQGNTKTLNELRSAFEMMDE